MAGRIFNQFIIHRCPYKKINKDRLLAELDKHRIIIVAGFQGLNKYDDITTLGRGGSDTSAVALAAALHADKCQIFTDVEGVYTTDLRKVKTQESFRKSPTTRCLSLQHSEHRF